MKASGNQHQVVDYENQPKTRTGGQHLQEFANADKKLTHSAFPAQHEYDQLRH
jgi:hypothetical protein